MILVFFFGAAFVLTLIAAYFTSFLASFLLEVRAANIAGFAFAAGQIGGILNQFNDGWASQVSALSGGLIALALVGYLFFKRKAR